MLISTDCDPEAVCFSTLSSPEFSSKHSHGSFRHTGEALRP